MSFPHPIGQPALDATPEAVDSPFYGLPVDPPNAIRAISFMDGLNGRYCTKTGMWVPAHRLKWYEGRPYLDEQCPTSPEIPPDPPQGLTS
jgi:hypothetical protein